MRQRNIVLLWVTLCLAITAWAGAILFAWLLLAMVQDRSILAGNSERTISKQATAAKMRALARDTIVERRLLDKKANVDVLSAVDAIESVGKISGAEVRVSDAQKEPTITGNPSVNIVAFSVEAQGTFSAVMRALAMLETLPLPVSIRQFDLGRSSDNGSDAGMWRLSLQLSLLTTANISS